MRFYSLVITGFLFFNRCHCDNIHCWIKNVIWSKYNIINATCCDVCSIQKSFSYVSVIVKKKPCDEANNSLTHGYPKAHWKNISAVSNKMETKSVPRSIAMFFPHLTAFVSESGILQKIHSDSFEDMKYLRLIDLSDNKITEIEDGAFRNLESLEFLILRNNFLTNIVETQFGNLKILQEIDISGNTVTKIDFEMIQFNTKLKVLKIYGLKVGNFSNCPINMEIQNVENIETVSEKIESSSNYTDIIMETQTETLSNNCGTLGIIDHSNYLVIYSLIYVSFFGAVWPIYLICLLINRKTHSQEENKSVSQ